MEQLERNFALLIDADNVSAKYITPMLEELSKYGNVTCKRIYGDWTNTQHSTWKEELLKNSISPIQQFSYTQGKNATDSAMIIDAMDLLYADNVDGFCIVSSDSDFTRLASRVRESGKMVVGMGEEKTPQPFRKACDVFTCLELLIEENEVKQDEVPVKGKKQTAQSQLDDTQERDNEKQLIEEAIVKIITENQNSDKETGLGEVGSRLVKLYPDFDVRRYGYSLLSKLLAEFSKIKIMKNGTFVSVALNENVDMRHAAESYIIDVVKESGSQGIDLAALGNKVHEKYSSFKIQDFGYSQFNKYVRDISHVQVSETEHALMATYKQKK